MRKRALLLFAMVIACGKNANEKPPEPAKPSALPAPPATPFVFDDGRDKHTLIHGNAIVINRGLEVHLTDAPIECPKAFASPGHTLWFTLPVGPEALWVGQEIDPHAWFRIDLDSQHELQRHRVTVRVAAIEHARIQGRIAIATSADRSVPLNDASGAGDFDIELCDAAAVEPLLKAPAPARGPLSGTLLGERFRLGRALVGTHGTGGLVFAEDATTSCAELKPSHAPPTARPSKGRSIRLSDFRASATPRPAGGWIVTATPAADGRLDTVEQDMPVGFSLTLEGDLDTPGSKVKGVLRGYTTSPERAMDVGGAYEAEVCAW